MSSEINRLVGARLQLARKRSALSELQMAAALKIEPFVYREIEVGRRRLDAPAMLICSRMTGVPLSWFFVGYWEDKQARGPVDATEENSQPTDQPESENVILFKLPAGQRDA